MSGPRFVAVPADRLVAELDDVGRRVQAQGGSFGWKRAGGERVFDLLPPKSAAVIRIYTSLPINGTEVRDCGEDAVRVVIGANVPDKIDGVLKFRPLAESRKILRTAPAKAEDRVGAFLARLREALRDAYAESRDVVSCKACGLPMARREGKNGAFMGCTGYPSCKSTAPVGGRGA